MQEVKLKAQKRDVLGRKVKNLRKEGVVPANIFGKKTKSLSVSLKANEFKSVFNEAGETAVVKLMIDGEKEERPILIRNVQKDPLTGEALHVDLNQISLTEKVTAQIPVELSGKSPAVEQKLGILIQIVNELEVEALPMDLPEHFMVDVSKLANVGDEVTVKDIAYDKSKVEVSTEDDELVLVKIEPLAEAEKVAPPTEEVVEKEAEAPKGETPAEGEGKPAEGGKEKKEEKQE